MKTLLKIFTVISLVTTPSFTIACQDNNSYDDIERPEPELPIQKIGFENVIVDDIDIQKISYNYDLYEQIINKLTKAGFKINNLNITLKKIGVGVINKDTSDLFRNGKYEWTFLDKNNENNKITASIIIRNSQHLADLFTNLSLGTIYDSRPRSILISLLTNNLGLINMINSIADQLIDEKKFIYNEDNTSAKIEVTKEDDFPKLSQGKEGIPKKFYGVIKVDYNVKPFDYQKVEDDKKRGVSLEELWKNINDYEESSDKKFNYNVGVINQLNIYSFLMTLIINNFSDYKSQIYWPILINDIVSDGDEAFNYKQSDQQGAINGKDYMVEIKFKPYSKSLPINNLNEEIDKVSYIIDQKENVKFYFRYLKEIK